MGTAQNTLSFPRGKTAVAASTLGKIQSSIKASLYLGQWKNIQAGFKPPDKELALQTAKSTRGG